MMFEGGRHFWRGPRLRPVLASLPVLLVLAGCATDQNANSSVDATWGLGKSRLAHAAAPAPTQPLAPTQPPAPTPALAKDSVDGAGTKEEAKGSASGNGGPAAAVPAPPPEPPPPPPESIVERAARLAAAARLGGDTLTAQALYRQVLSEQPQNLPAQLGLAHTLADLGDLEAVRPMINQLVQAFPQNDQVLALAARIDMIAGDLSAASVRLALGASFSPDCRDILQVQGMFEDLRGNHTAAQQAYGKILAATPGDVAVINNMALSQMAAGDAVSVLPLLEPLVNGRPTVTGGAAVSEVVPPASRHNLAMAYGLLGREDDARRLLVGDMSEAAVESNLKFYRWIKARRLPENRVESARPITGLSSPLTAPLRRD